MSSKRGLIAYKCNKKSFNQTSFGEFISTLRSPATNTEPIYIVLDNCSIHKAGSVKKLMAELNITPIWNVPYQPSLNGIEQVWAMAKFKYRKYALGIMTDVEPYASIEGLVHRVMGELETLSIQRCCDNSTRLILATNGVDVN